MREKWNNGLLGGWALKCNLLLDSPQISYLLWVSDFAEGERKIFIHEAFILMPFHVLRDLRLIRVRWLGVNRETLRQRQKGHSKCMSWGRWGQSTHVVKSRCLRLQWNKSLGQEAKQVKSDARVIYFSACFGSEKCSSLFLILYIQRECKNQIIKKSYFDFDWNYVKWIDFSVENHHFYDT